MSKKRVPTPLPDLAQQIYDRMSGDAFSVSQLADMLGIDYENDDRGRDALHGALQTLEERRLIAVAVDRKAEPYFDGGPVGADTFRHYRIDESDILTARGRLSPAREVEVGREILADLLGIYTFEQSRRRERGKEAQAAISRLFGPERK